MEFIPDSLKLSGSLSVNNLDPESGYPAGWSGGIHAQEIYAEAKVGVGSKGELKISLSKDGDAYFAGKLSIGTTNPTHIFHVLADDAVGLFESTGQQAYLRLSTAEGLNNRVEITNRPGGRLSLWTAGGGDVFNITRAGKVGIGTIDPRAALHVEGGAIFNWLAIGCDPPTGINPPWPYETISTIDPNHNLRLHSNLGIYFHVGNRAEPSRGIAPNGDWWGSSRQTKENIQEFSDREAAETLSGLNPVKYVLKADQEKKLHIGFIAEDVPAVIGSPDKKMISVMDIVAVLTKVVKEQQQTILALTEEVTVLKTRLNL